MLFATKAVLLSFIPLICALTERDLEQAYHAQARVVSLLKGRQVTTTPCSLVPAPATCASSCGPGWITCPGGSADDCYNPATAVCCGDGTTCPVGEICNNSSLTCDPGSGGAGTVIVPTYTPPAVSSTYTPPAVSSTYKPTSTYYTPTTPNTLFGAASSSTETSPFFSFASTAAAGTSTGGLGGLVTVSSKTTDVGSTPTTSSSGIAFSSSGNRLGHYGEVPWFGLPIIIVSIMASLLLL